MNKMKKFVKILYYGRYLLYFISLLTLAATLYYAREIINGEEDDLWILVYLSIISVSFIYGSWRVRRFGRFLFFTKTPAEIQEVYAEIITKLAKEPQVELEVEELEVQEKVEQVIDFENSYDKMKVAELREIAKERNIPKYLSMKKAELIEALQQKK